MEVPVINGSKCATESIQFFSGHVSLIVDDAFIVKLSGSQKVKAHCAASCLFEPIISDQVAIVKIEQVHHILSILQRNSEQEARLNFSGDVSLKSKSGSVHINARTVGIEGRQQLSFLSNYVSLASSSAKITINSLSFVGQHCQATVGKIHQVTDFLSQTLGVVQQKIRQVSRRVQKSTEQEADPDSSSI